MERGLKIIVGACVVAGVIGIILFYSNALPENNHMKGEAVPFTILGEGTTASGFTEAKNFRITTKERLEELWMQVYGTSEPVPNVDFTKHHVYAVFGGEQPTSGHYVGVSEVFDTRNVRHVTITHTTPDEQCVTLQMITYPYQFVQVDASSLPISRSNASATRSCE